MGSLKDQQLYTNAVEKHLPWYRWSAVVCAILLIIGFSWPQSIFGELIIGAAVIFILMVYVYVEEKRRLRRLKAADARKEYILHKEFRQKKKRSIFRRKKHQNDE